MKALRLYEPLLNYMCRVNRLSRNGVPLSYGEVRNTVLELLASAEKSASQDALLKEHVNCLHTPIKYFVDDVIAQSKLPFAQRWHKDRLGFAMDGLAGDEAFFDCFLDRDLKKPPSAVLAEQLLVYYTCLGLGFQGVYFREPEKIRSYMRSMHPAVRQFLVEDSVARMVPQPYECTDTRDFVRPPKLKRSLILATLLALIAAGLPLYYWMGERLAGKSNLQLREILNSHQGTAPTK